MGRGNGVEVHSGRATVVCVCVEGGKGGTPESWGPEQSALPQRSAYPLPGLPSVPGIRVCFSPRWAMSGAHTARGGFSLFAVQACDPYDWTRESEAAPVPRSESDTGPRAQSGFLMVTNAVR